MIDVVYHEYQKVDRHHIGHSYLIDVGDEIEIQQVMEYKWKVYDSVILKPPHPKTRYFELVITEYRDKNVSLIDDLQVYPVIAKKRPDFRILGFTLRRGDWVVTEQIYKKANTTEIQWIYSDDFHLFAITHAQDQPETIVEQVVAKIDGIASSIKSGYRIYSHMENQRMRREAFDAVLESQSGVTINKTAILKHPEFQLIAELGEGDRKKMQDEILRDLVALGATLDTFGGSNKIVAKLEIPKKTDINVQLAQIEELQDLGWLFE
ncbi:MAG: hypothetical protein ABSB80_06615 [Methanoregula sp.]|jgi:hypothetical protein|uniref:hypothetical protein n=1 Tax=Methanoregula sp. TaxID=2052170 RepID=UPI003D0D1AE4